MTRGKTAARWFVALGHDRSGVMHFVRPDAYVAIVPDYLPAHVLLVQISGIAELLGGVGLLLPSLEIRRGASYGLLALLVAVFPANLNQAIHDIPMNGRHVPMALLWIRLPLQLVLLWITWWCTSPSSRDPST